MPVPNTWTRLLDGLRKTVNLISITILFVAAVLTNDYLLLLVGIGTEIVYLITYLSWPSISRRFAKRDTPPNTFTTPFKEIKNALLAEPTRRNVTFLDGWLLVVTVAGFVIILFFGFGKHLLSHPWPYLTHAEGWDAGAIFWTGFFLLYYTWKFPFTKDRIVDKVIISIISWFSLPLLYFAWIWIRSPIKHVLAVWLIGVCFFVIDLLISKRHPDPMERNLSRTSLYWADLPMVVAFLLLMGYLALHRDTEHPDVFVSGVVSCQLLISNAVFVVMEFGLLRSATAGATGLVQDASEVPIKGATLTAKSLDTNLTQATTSDDNGRFEFLYLPAGKHEITVEAAGFTTQEQAFLVTAGEAIELLLTISPRYDDHEQQKIENNAPIMRESDMSILGSDSV